MGPRNIRYIAGRLARGVVLLGLSGCCCWNTWMYDEGGCKDPGHPTSPLGTSVNSWLEEHAARAEANDFTIYLTEWYMGGCDLGPYGLHHLSDIVRRLPEVPFPVVIEPHLDADVNEKRRILIVNALTSQGIGDAEQRVVVSYPQAEGLYGEEGEMIFYDMFQNRSGYGGFGGFGGYNGRRGSWGGGWNRGGWGGGWGGGFGGWGRGGFGYNTGYFGDNYIR